MESAVVIASSAPRVSFAPRLFILSSSFASAANANSRSEVPTVVFIVIVVVLDFAAWILPSVFFPSSSSSSSSSPSPSFRSPSLPGPGPRNVSHRSRTSVSHVRARIASISRLRSFRICSRRRASVISRPVRARRSSKAHRTRRVESRRSTVAPSRSPACLVTTEKRSPSRASTSCARFALVASRKGVSRRAVLSNEVAVSWGSRTVVTR